MTFLLLFSQGARWRPWRATTSTTARSPWTKLDWWPASTWTTRLYCRSCLAGTTTSTERASPNHWLVWTLMDLKGHWQTLCWRWKLITMAGISEHTLGCSLLMHSVTRTLDAVFSLLKWGQEPSDKITIDKHNNETTFSKSCHHHVLHLVKHR